MEIIYWSRIVVFLVGTILTMRGNWKAGIQLITLAVFEVGFELGLPDGTTLESLRANGLTEVELLKCFIGGMFLTGAFAFLAIWIAPNVLMLMTTHERVERRD